MRRFFVDQSAIDGDEAVLNADESHHLAKVLRLTTGGHVQLFDGEGTVYDGVILETGALNRARVRILSSRQETASTRPLVIAQAILRGGKMDELLQRYTELGVDTFVPIWTSRCQGSFNQSKEIERQARQRRIVEAACKQSGRAHPLRLARPQSFADFLDDYSEEQPGWRRLMFWEEEEATSLRDISFADAGAIVAVIGPTGGLTPEEAAMARAHGFYTVRLAGHILRAETAGITVAALCQFLLSNI